MSISWIRVLFLGAWCAYFPWEFEESRDGKREMAAETSQPVTLTSTFFLYRVVTQRSSLHKISRILPDFIKKKKKKDFQLVFNFEQTRTVTIFGEHGIIAHIP